LDKGNHSVDSINSVAEETDHALKLKALGINLTRPMTLLDLAEAPAEF
jgi:hypothetical protein